MRPVVFLLSASMILVIRAGAAQQPGAAAYKPVIPKTWDARALADLQLPLVDASRSPRDIAPRRLLPDSGATDLQDVSEIPAGSGTARLSGMA